MDSTFRIKSCDWRTSMLKWPVTESVCYLHIQVNLEKSVKKPPIHTLAKRSNNSVSAQTIISDDSRESSTRVSIV